MGNPVKEVRDAHGLTQEEMAERIGCGKTTLRRCEYTSRLPQNSAVLKNLRQLAQEKGIDIDNNKQKVPA